MAPFRPLAKNKKNKSKGFTVSNHGSVMTELLSGNEEKFRKAFPEYRGIFVHNKYDCEPCYARMGLVFCKCKACRCLGMAERKFLYGQKGETGFPEEYKLVKGCSYFVEIDYCQLVDAFFSDTLVSNETLNHRLAEIRRKKKAILKIFPEFDGDKIVWDEDGNFCFFRMNVVYCTCVSCEGLKLKQQYVKYVQSRGFTNYSGPSDPPGFCRFENQAHENAKWELTNPEFKTPDVSVLFDDCEGIPIDIV